MIMHVFHKMISCIVIRLIQGQSQGQGQSYILQSNLLYLYDIHLCMTTSRKVANGQKKHNTTTPETTHVQ